MKNQNSLFVVFCLCLTVGIMAAYAGFVGHFNGHDQYELRLAQLQKQVEKEKFNNALLTYQLKDFQQSVAQVLPDDKKLQANYELRNFAAVVRSPASEDAIDLSAVLYEKGKKYFNDKDYDKAIKEFNGLLDKFPLSQHGVEAHFFIAESYFLKKDFRSSLTEIDNMVTQFPQHDLTGFILLRMGQISELNNQTEEASEIYKTVSKNFKNEDLKKQARKLAQSVEYR
ncbi:outer membrane protein assembly factor BamD [uncultured Bdellovibrio sp.]|uniref:outer membrane protein assembly factor BamD n=1 Tax=Bdellovibrio sp. HCB-162 TaxID=3394234 RepID=UPI0025EB2CD5|nr:outer membrane protein assembly factor BamD [uncultured Bdellovibrio sp.]